MYGGLCPWSGFDSVTAYEAQASSWSEAELHREMSNARAGIKPAGISLGVHHEVVEGRSCSQIGNSKEETLHSTDLVCLKAFRNT